MRLRDYLNEFELDWAQAPVRSELIPGKKMKGARVLLVGGQTRLQEAVAWSFLAWNDQENAGITVQEAECCEGKLRVTREYGVSEMPSGYAAGKSQPVHRVDEMSSGYAAAGYAVDETQSECGSMSGETPKTVDYVILTGYCCRDFDLSVRETVAYLREFSEMLRAVAETGCKRVLLLSDGRVYGRLAHEFAASEYESGRTDTSSAEFDAQYFMQALESLLLEAAREHGFAYEVLRTGMIYGPCIPMMEHEAAVLARRTAQGEAFELALSPERTSYVCIHDVLTAVQFVLTRCPENKIYNVSGEKSDVSNGDIAMMLYRNFPGKCCFTMRTEASAPQGRVQPEERADGLGQNRELNHEQSQGSDHEQSRARGALLNTQLLRHYGFIPQISLEDGLIILVKSLQNTGEVFIFDNTYYGKLDKVQQILLGYLLEIDRICKKHNIKYFLAGGTLLGAIRHHGFIPWDDDADVMMLREDYDHFLEVVQQELPDNIFLQLPETEKGNYNPFTKLRINNTMFATEFTGHFMNMHNGIFFDVLSHDRTGRKKWSQKLHLMVTMLTRSVVFNKWGNTDVKGGGRHPVICKIVSKVKYLVPMRFAVWAQNKSLTFFKGKDTGYLYDGMGRNLKRGSFPAAWLDEAVYVDFEGYQFPVPKEYDKYLTYLYGDYMQMIPVSQRRTSHSIVLTDLGEYGNYSL